MTGQPVADRMDGRTPAADAVAVVPRNHAERGSQLAERIVGHAVRSGLGPGGRMPTERQLAADLGVTRSAVRYALAILQARGHLSREVGRGTYLRSQLDEVTARTGATARRTGVLLATADGEAAGSAAFAPADVMMVRRLLEPPAMPLAVAWATASDLAEMDRCLAGGDRAASYEEFEAWDLALHASIIAATHSPLLVTLYAAVGQARHGRMWGDLKRRSSSAGRRKMYCSDHHRIVAAIKQRDPARAVQAMRDHLARVSDHLNATDPAAGSYS